MPTSRFRNFPTLPSSPRNGRDPAPAFLAEDLALERDSENPFRRHLAMCVLGHEQETAEAELSGERLARLRDLPRPLNDRHEAGRFTPAWHSVALFFNLNMPAADLPAGYARTLAADALEWLDEGTDPVEPGVSDFMCNYWGTLSYGNLVFGVNTPRDAAGTPLIPTITPPGGDPQNWGALIRACIDANAEAIWRAAGSLRRDGKRWIPSVVLVQNYNVGASAYFTGFDHSVGGETYLVGDYTHVRFSLTRWSPPDAPDKIGRRFWSTLAHEYGHNFLEFWDLYGPQGCTGYWDLLGDNSPPGRMSEVCSAFKARVGWLSFKEVIQGPDYAARELSLRPYTTSAEAYKVVPDPENNPFEYFLLEHRTSTGQETWRPDGALPDGGLFIIHINERMGVHHTWLLRAAPYFDPEFADASDLGATKWTGHDDIAGKTFPNGARNSFTRSTTPSSDFYGGRPSGLSITDIRVEGDRVRFRLGIRGNPRVGWTVSERDRALAGRFSAESATGGEEVFIRNEDAAALLVHRDAQWFAVRREEDWIGGWNLGRDNRELVGDFDRDGRDEIYVRSPEWAGVIKWRLGRFETVTVQQDWIDGWNLGPDNWETIADVDGDGADEIVIRSPDWMGLLKLVGGRLRLQSIQNGWIGEWNLGRDNREYPGRFRRRDADDVVVRSPEWLGLMSWDTSAREFRLVGIQHDWIDGWNLGAQDRMHVGDFDGDGLEEIYIRSPGWAGILKWRSNRFRVVWMTRDRIEHANGDPASAQALSGRDQSHAGRFRMDRDGILHRRPDGIAILAWDGGAMKAQHAVDGNLGAWALGPGDNYVLGDFHRTAPDVVEAPRDHVIDGLTDVFLHNGWGTGMIGVNHGHWIPGTDSLLDQFGLTWIQRRTLMFDR